ncbi:hypothetical protein CF319_g8990 [Tilletia indica]|nr:hypothetical protein CF319_g8990 [Tilletia indica]
MSSTTQFLSFSPSNRLPSRSIAFHTSDHLQLTLGGTYSRPYSASRPFLQDSPFLFEESTIANDQATILCAGGNIILTHQNRDGTTRINGRPLDRDQRVLLHHGDQIDLGYYEPMDDEYTFNLFLHVEVTSSPPPSAPHRSGSISVPTLLPTTPSVLHYMHTLQNSHLQLREELVSTKRQLKESLAAAAAHTCTPSLPPRPYASLLADLRDRAADGTDADVVPHSNSLVELCSSPSPSTFASTPSAPFLSVPSATPSSLSNSSSSVLRSAESTTLSPPMIPESTSPSSSPTPTFPSFTSSPPSASTSALCSPFSTTSVLTSVLRSTPTSTSTSPPPSAPPSASASASVWTPATPLATSASPTSARPSSSATAPSPSVSSSGSHPASSSQDASISASSPSALTSPSTLALCSPDSSLPASSSPTMPVPASALARSSNSSAARLTSSAALRGIDTAMDTNQLHLSAASSSSVTTRRLGSAEVALARVGAQWMTARRELSDVHRHVRSAEVAKSRVLHAWNAARTALMASPAAPAPSVTPDSVPLEDDIAAHQLPYISAPIIAFTTSTDGSPVVARRSSSSSATNAYTHSHINSAPGPPRYTPRPLPLYTPPSPTSTPASSSPLGSSLCAAYPRWYHVSFPRLLEELCTLRTRLATHYHFSHQPLFVPLTALQSCGPFPAPTHPFL